jgi:hypothetical protein
MPQLRLGTGREVAWVVAAGFYPSFGDKSRLRTKYASQEKPRLTPSLHMYGLPHRKAFGGITPAASTIGTPSARNLISGGPPQRGFTMAPSAVGDVEQKLRAKLFAAGAKYTLRGHHAWWSAGTDLMNINALARDLYASMIGIRPNASSAGELKEATNIIYSHLISNFREFESSRGHAATRNMIDIITEKSLEGADLDEFVTQYWNLNDRDVDVPEEEWRDLLQSGLLSQADAVYRRAGDSISDANKIDVSVMITRLNEAMRLDVTEALITDDAPLGGHGVLRRMDWTAPGSSATPQYAWVEANRADVETDIANHFRQTIEDDFNPVIRNLIAVASSPPNIPTPLDIVGPTSEQIKAGAVERALYTSDFYENADPGDFSELFAALDRITAGGSRPGDYAVKGGKKGKKKKALIRFLLHSISNINALGTDSFYQAHRVSDRNRYGDAFYAVVPMSQITQGDSEWPSPGASDWPAPAYEYRSEGERSPAETLVLSGPNATLAMLMHTLGPNSMNVWKAREINLFQNRVYITKQFHSANAQQMNDRGILSTTNAETTEANKHAFTVSYSPKDMIGFFAKFVQQLSNGLSSKEAKKIGEAAIGANNYPLGSQGQSRFGPSGAWGGPGSAGHPAPGKFWALPYIAFEDTLERKAGEIYSWFNQEAEKLNSDHAIKGGKIRGGWAGLGGAAKSRGGH